MLESLGVPHRVAAARSGDLTPLNVRLPVPEAFDTALIYLTDHQLWLDPSCQDCEPGQVHSRFEGGAALLLPVKRHEAPLPLPSKKSNAP